MRRDTPTQAGIAFTLIVAGATLAVAVIAGLFLIFEPGVNGVSARYGMLTPVRGAITTLWTEVVRPPAHALHALERR